MTTQLPRDSDQTTSHPAGAPVDTSTIDRTYAHLDSLRDRFPNLRPALVPGTRRRWAQTELTDVRRAVLNELARQDREAKEHNIARGIPVIGESPAPLRLDVLDAIATITRAVETLEAELCEEYGLTPLQSAGTPARITRIVGLLDRVAEREELADWLHGEAAWLNRMAGLVLDDEEPIRRLNARCPHCRAVSLRAFPDRELVVCVNAGCRCETNGCPCQDERPRRHSWTYDEWPELADITPAVAA